MPTTHRWQGDAKAVKDIWTFTPGGTIAAGSTFAFTVNGNTLAYTATGTTAASVTAGVAAMWNNTQSPPLDPPPPKEFAEYYATDNAGTVTFTATKAGVPGTIGVAAGGSGSPTASCTNTTAATGPNFIDNTANWSSGSAIGNGDTLVFDSGSVPCLYGFASLAAVTALTIKILQGWNPSGGGLGLPETNENGYAEYRAKYLTIDGATLIEIDNSQISRVRIATGTSARTLIVRNTGQRVDPLVPVVLITGSHASNADYVVKGDVGFAFFAGEAASSPTYSQTFRDNPDSDARVEGGTGWTVTTINKGGGTLLLRNGATTINTTPKSGRLQVDAGAVTTLNAEGGDTIYNSTSALGTATLGNDARLYFDQDPRAKTVTNAIALYGKECHVFDTLGVAGVAGDANTLHVTLNHGASLSQIHNKSKASAAVTVA